MEVLGRGLLVETLAEVWVVAVPPLPFRQPARVPMHRPEFVRVTRTVKERAAKRYGKQRLVHCGLDGTRRRRCRVMHRVVERCLVPGTMVVGGGRAKTTRRESAVELGHGRRSIRSTVEVPCAAVEGFRGDSGVPITHLAKQLLLSSLRRGLGLHIERWVCRGSPSHPCQSSVHWMARAVGVILVRGASNKSMVGLVTTGPVIRRVHRVDGPGFARPSPNCFPRVLRGGPVQAAMPDTSKCEIR
jgi:hypothetical protein